MKFMFMSNAEIIAKNKETVKYWYDKVRGKGNKSMYIYEYIASKCGCTARTAMKYVALIRKDNIVNICK